MVPGEVRDSATLNRTAKTNLLGERHPDCLRRRASHGPRERSPRRSLRCPPLLADCCPLDDVRAMGLGDEDHVECAVEFAVAASVEAVSGWFGRRRSGDRCGARQQGTLIIPATSRRFRSRAACRRLLEVRQRAPRDAHLHGEEGSTVWVCQRAFQKAPKRARTSAPGMDQGDLCWGRQPRCRKPLLYPLSYGGSRPA